MVAISEVRAANAALNKQHDSMTAVFVGATAGIGLATLKAFATHIPHPKAIIIGRSRSKFTPELENLKRINSSGEYTFLEADVSLIRNIDKVTNEVKALVSHIDLLFTSQGYISFNGRENNADGLDNSFSLRYYGRVRFTQNLLSLLRPDGRALTVLAGGQEGKIFEDDLDLETNYSIANSMGQLSSMLTLSYDQLAKGNPGMSFLHVFPGLVGTELLGKSATGILGYLFRWVVEPLMSFFVTSPKESGERMLNYATTEQFAKGSWPLDWDGTVKENAVLKGYRERGMADKIMEHNAKIFERVAA